MSRRRGRRGSNKGKLGFITLALLTVIIIAGLFIYDAVYAPPKTDQLTQCPIDPSYIPRDVLVLIDTSNPMVGSQVQRLNNILNNLIQNLETYARVRVFSLDSESATGITQNTATVCRGDQSWMDSPLQRLFSESVTGNLPNRVLSNIDNENEQDFSPIIDALRMLAEIDERNSNSLDLYVFSDLLIHTPTFSMYRNNWYQNEYIPNRQSLINQRPIFRDSANITLYALMRPELNLQNEEWREFWIQYLTGTSNLTNVNLRFEAITGGL